MSTNFVILAKFSNEYDFLLRLLKYYSHIQTLLNSEIQLQILIESHFWSGKVNQIDTERLLILKNTFPSFSYLIINHNQGEIENISRRCREDLANCYLSEMIKMHKNDNCVLIIADLDEVLDLRGFKYLLQSKHKQTSNYSIPYFILQRTVWFTTKYSYDEKWHGPVAFLQYPGTNMAALSQSNRHLPDARTYSFESGFHLSYLKSSIISKANNSHGLRYARARLFLALMSVHPFRRKYKSYNRKKLTSDQQQLLEFFDDLSFNSKDLLSLAAQK
jgi:hypothetical protein